MRKWGGCAVWWMGPLLSVATVAYIGAPKRAIMTDESASCAYWARHGYCERTSEHAVFMENHCMHACANNSGADAAPNLPANHLSVDAWANPADCKKWAHDGECTKNAEFMKTSCAESCATHDRARQRYEQRCPKPAVHRPALPAGMMSTTVARIMSDFAHLQPEQISFDPPVVLFHRFLSDKEADAFIKHGTGRYQRSLGVGVKADGTMGNILTDIRTSSQAWCQHAECLKDPHVENVARRVSDITQTPSTNAEYAQLVYYHACNKTDPTQTCAFYRRHSDYNADDEHQLPGVRIYTLFAYLNDVEAGGGTRFTDLPGGPITIQPRRGKAILWPSVLLHSPHEKDDRTHHEALPVTAGEKFGANFWIHQYDFKGPHARGCTGHP